ncbi:MAG TPA: response regulator transcription factor [Rubricoccaceae bacterium]
MPPSPISVLVVDDHAVVREAVSDLVAATAGLAVWGTAVSGDDALAQLERTGSVEADRIDGPIVVVTDVQIPGMNGLELVAEVCSRWPSLPCLVISAKQEYASLATVAGAVGFIEKGDPAGLIAAVFRAGAGAE